jgi:hypothetical protein
MQVDLGGASRQCWAMLAGWAGFLGGGAGGFLRRPGQILFGGKHGGIFFSDEAVGNLVFP